jgi:16S rRNA (uracil1498-N3)-methyltransferase
MEKRRQHWQKIAITACEQCGRNVLPALYPITPISEWLREQSAQFAFVLSPTGGSEIKEMVVPSDASISLLIGPEGGLSDNEIQQAVNGGFIPLKLGGRILRTETAAVAALTVMQTLWGDFLN